MSCIFGYQMRFITDGLLKHLRPRGDDDFVDRLNYYYTPTLLILASIVVSGKQYVAKPIQCWIPPQFTHSMEEYIESYCWIQNTYWLPANEHIPDEYDDRESRQIGYYQWVPFILLLQGFLFTLPCMWWRLTNRRSGLDLNQLINSARDVQMISDPVDKSRMFSCIARCLADVLNLQTGLISLKRVHSLRTFPCYCWTIRCRRSGYYVTISYLITKFVYAINAVGQFFLVNLFLKNGPYQLYGFRVLSELLSGRDWTKSGHFPRVTLCDFEVRSVGNLNRFTVQCALTVNVFNEKIFIFVWIWLCVIAVVSTGSLCCWFFTIVFRCERLSFISEYLYTAGVMEPRNRSLFHAHPVITYQRFLDRFLRIDGVFALRMIAIHTGDLATVEITKRLWILYSREAGLDKDQNNGIGNSPDAIHENNSQEHCRPLLITGTEESLVFDYARDMEETEN